MAKSSKGAKKAAPKKTAVKKAVSKKAAPKKAASKKTPAKKVTVKKAAKKVFSKVKAAVKKVAPKKATVKKAVKKVAKKIVPNKVAAKKAAPKKSAVKKASPQKKNSKKATDNNHPSILGMVAAIAKDKVKKTFTKAVEAVESIIPGESKEESTSAKEDAATAKADKKDADDENGTVGAAAPDTAAPVTDPLTSFDKHAYQKATTKGDPHGKIHLNTQNKSSIRPSGKKPLWRK